MSPDRGGWTAIQRRQDGSTDFYKTWSEYKQGFGESSTNYWIGNDAIYKLTKNKDREIRVELKSFDGAEAYAQYSTFYVGNEDSKYKLTVSGFSGTAGRNEYEFLYSILLQHARSSRRDTLELVRNIRSVGTLTEALTCRSIARCMSVNLKL
ncbi:ficolin-1-like [Saccostrea cucullata]|uniref:ficolin-1-like n=1 Tax=Saccostrea cuccullata TaxID=36930 RepID=UPI002ED4470A